MNLKFPLELKAGTVELKNTGNSDKIVNVYIPNKDSVYITLPAGQSMNVTTLSAGESFTYLSQASEDLTVEIKAETTGTDGGGE